MRLPPWCPTAPPARPKFAKPPYQSLDFVYNFTSGPIPITLISQCNQMDYAGTNLLPDHGGGKKFDFYHYLDRVRTSRISKLRQSG
jgi:hypothetical protein